MQAEQPSSSTLHKTASSPEVKGAASFLPPMEYLLLLLVKIHPFPTVFHLPFAYTKCWINQCKLYYFTTEVYLPCICLPLMSLTLLCSHRSPANFLLAISNFNMGPKVVLPWRRQPKFLLPPIWECKMNMVKMCAHCQSNCECFLCL